MPEGDLDSLFGNSHELEGELRAAFLRKAPAEALSLGHLIFDRSCERLSIVEVAGAVQAKPRNAPELPFVTHVLLDLVSDLLRPL